MLKSVTWGQFFALSGCLLAIYYLIIGSIYYRKEVKNLVKGKRLAVSPPARQAATAVDASASYAGIDDIEDSDSEQSQIYEQVNSLTDDLGDLFNAAVAEGWDKEQTLALVGRKLANHQNLADTPFETSVNNYIVIQADKSGFTRVSAAQLRGLWKNG